MKVRALLGTLLLVVGCASEADSDRPLFSAGGRGISAYLTQLPLAGLADLSQDEIAAIPSVTYGDAARAADIAGVQPPSDLRNEDAIRRYLHAITARGAAPRGEELSSVAIQPPEVVNISDTDTAAGLREFVDEMGWSFLQVDSYAETRPGPDRVTVLEGDFDERLLNEALGEPHDGVWLVGDPDDAYDIDDRTVARPTGGPLWLARDGDRLIVAQSEELLRATQDIDRADSASMADVVPLASIARALDQQGAYTAQLVGGSFVPIPFIEAALGEIDEVCEDMHMSAPVAVASGLADDDGPVILVVRAHLDQATAQEDADLLRQLLEEGESVSRRAPWSEVVELDEVTTDGALVIARLRPVDDSDALLWRQGFQEQDSLWAAFC